MEEVQLRMEIITQTDYFTLILLGTGVNYQGVIDEMNLKILDYV